MLPAGKLRYRITFEQRNVTKDAAGQESTSWIAIAGLSNIPSRIEPISGAEKLKASAINSQLSHKITVRYQSQFSDPLAVTTYRINFGGRIFDIESVVNFGERNHWIQISCIEGGGQ